MIQRQILKVVLNDRIRTLDAGVLIPKPCFGPNRRGKNGLVLRGMQMVAFDFAVRDIGVAKELFPGQNHS